MLNFPHYKKIRTGLLLLCLLIGAGSAIATPHLAHAVDLKDVPGIGPLADAFEYLYPGSWLPKIADVFGQLISGLLSAFISFAGLLINLALLANATLLQSPVIKVGFSVSLALMNLGLVVAALWIAVATIAEPVLGNDTYPIKKLLPRLILVAVLGNFLLLGAGTFIKFSDGLSFYLVSKTSPGLSVNTSGGVASNIADNVGAYLRFSSTLANAFKPQALLKITDILPSTLTAGSLITAASGTLAAQWKAIANISFIVLFELFIFIIMLLIAILFLIRYIYLGVLLIFGPLALLTSLFPGLSSHWKSWCTKLVHWAMFGPLAILGLYFAIISAQLRGDTVQQTTGTATPGAISYVGGLAALVSGAPGTAVDALKQQVGRDTGFFTTLAEMVMVLGIAGGGIAMASSFAPKFAGAAITGATTLGKKAKGYIGAQVRTRGAQVLGGAINTQARQADYARMQQSSNPLTRWRGRLSQSALTGLSRTGEKDAESWVARRTKQQLVDNYSTMNEAQKIAALERMRKENLLNQVPAATLATDLPKLKEAFTRRGLLSTYDAISKESGHALLTAPGSEESLKQAVSGAAMGNLAGVAFANRAKIEAEGGKIGISAADQEKLQLRLMRSLLLLGDPNKLAAAAQAASNAGQLDVFKNTLHGVARDIAARVQSAGFDASQYNQPAIKRYLGGNAAAALGLGTEDIEPLTNAMEPKPAPSVAKQGYDTAVDDGGEARVPRSTSGATQPLVSSSSPSQIATPATSQNGSSPTLAAPTVSEPNATQNAQSTGSPSPVTLDSDSINQLARQLGGDFDASLRAQVAEKISGVASAVAGTGETLKDIKTEDMRNARKSDRLQEETANNIQNAVSAQPGSEASIPAEEQQLVGKA